jgi:hypothetical protein
MADGQYAYRWLYNKKVGLHVWPVEKFAYDQHDEEMFKLGLDVDDYATTTGGYIYTNKEYSPAYGLAEALLKQWVQDNPDAFVFTGPSTDSQSDYYRPEVYPHSNPFESAVAPQTEQLFDTEPLTTPKPPPKNRNAIKPHIIDLDWEDYDQHGGGLTGMFFTKSKNLYVATGEVYHLHIMDELQPEDSLDGYLGGNAAVIPFRVERNGNVEMYEHMIAPKDMKWVQPVEEAVAQMWPELERKGEWYDEEDYYDEESSYEPSAVSVPPQPEPVQDRIKREYDEMMKAGSGNFVVGRYIYDGENDILYPSHGVEGHWDIATRNDLDYTGERWEGERSKYEFGYVFKLDDGSYGCWPVTDFYREGPMSARATELLPSSDFQTWDKTSSSEDSQYICTFIYTLDDGLLLGGERETHWELLYEVGMPYEYYAENPDGMVLGWVFEDPDGNFKAIIDSIEFGKVVDPEIKDEALEALSGQFKGITEAPSDLHYRTKQEEAIMGYSSKLAGAFKPIDLGPMIDAHAEEDYARGLKFVYDPSADQTYYWYFSDYDGQPWHTDAIQYLCDAMGFESSWGTDVPPFVKGYYYGGWNFYDSTPKKEEIKQELMPFLPANLEEDQEDYYSKVKAAKLNRLSGSNSAPGDDDAGPDRSNLRLEATYVFNVDKGELFAEYGFALHPYMIEERCQDDDYNWSYEDDYECGRVYRDTRYSAERGEVIPYWVDHYSVERDWAISQDSVKAADAAIEAWLLEGMQDPDVGEYPFTVEDYNEYGPGGGLIQVAKAAGMYNRRWIQDVDGTYLVNNGEDSTHLNMYVRLHPELVNTNEDKLWDQFMQTRSGGYIYEDDPAGPTVEWYKKGTSEAALKGIQDYLAQDAQLAFDI